MLVPEKELPIQIAEVNGIKVDDMDFAKAGQDKVFEQFAADASSSYQ